MLGETYEWRVFFEESESCWTEDSDGFGVEHTIYGYKKGGLAGSSELVSYLYSSPCERR